LYLVVSVTLLASVCSAELCQWLSRSVTKQQRESVHDHWSVVECTSVFVLFVQVDAQQFSVKHTFGEVIRVLTAVLVKPRFAP
jgi:hypothetical protein